MATFKKELKGIETKEIISSLVYPSPSHSRSQISSSIFLNFFQSKIIQHRSFSNQSTTMEKKG